MKYAAKIGLLMEMRDQGLLCKCGGWLEYVDEDGQEVMRLDHDFDCKAYEKINELLDLGAKDEAK
jgi:hypothetical protein